MHRFPATLIRPLGVVIAAAVFGLSGCSSHGPKPSAPGSEPAAPVTSSAPAVPATAPLPPPEALTDVLARLADPNVPGTAKLNLVEGATPERAATLDKFSHALGDN